MLKCSSPSIQSVKKHPLLPSELPPPEGHPLKHRLSVLERVGEGDLRKICPKALFFLWKPDPPTLVFFFSRFPCFSVFRFFGAFFSCKTKTPQTVTLQVKMERGQKATKIQHAIPDHVLAYPLRRNFPAQKSN